MPKRDKRLLKRPIRGWRMCRPVGLMAGNKIFNGGNQLLMINNRSREKIGKTQGALRVSMNDRYDVITNIQRKGKERLRTRCRPTGKLRVPGK